MTKPKNNYDHTGAKRAAAYKERQEAKGIGRVSVQAYPDDRDAILKHAAELRAKREGASHG